MSDQCNTKENINNISFERFLEIVHGYCSLDHYCDEKECAPCRDHENSLRSTYDTISRRSRSKVTTKDAANVGATIQAQLPETEW